MVPLPSAGSSVTKALLGILKLEAKPGAIYRVELFSSSGCDIGDHGEAERFLGFLETTTSVEGLATFAATIPNFTLPTNHVITATATDSTGSTSEFSMCVPLVELVGLEAVQVIQDWKNSVKLIEEKRTLVRAHVQRNGPGPAVKEVKVELHGSRGGIGLPRSPLTPANKKGGALDAETNAADRRGDLEGSFYFILPKSWTSGTIQLEIESLDHVLDCKEAAGTPQDCTAEVTFEPAPGVPDFKFIRYTVQEPVHLKYVASVADIAQYVRTMEAMFPVNRISWTHRKLDRGRTIGGIMTMRTLSFLNRIAENYRQNDGCTTNPSCKNRIYLLAIRGATRSELLAAYPDGEVPLAAKAGIVPGIGLATSPPSRSASGMVFPRKDHFIVVETMLGHVFSGVNPFNFVRSILAHETGHLFDNDHIVHSSQGTKTIGGTTLKKGFCGELGPNSAPDYPYTAQIDGLTLPTLGPMDQGEDEKIFGLDTMSMMVADPTENFPLMSYCGKAIGQLLFMWPSMPTYEAMFTQIADQFGTGGSATVNAALAPEDYLVVRGTIDLIDDTAEFEPFSRITSQFAPDPLPTGEYLLELLDGGDNTVTALAFDPGQDHGFGGEDPGLASFLIPVLEDAAIRKARLSHGGNVLTMIEASPTPPIVQVTSPNGGETLDGETVTIEWTGTDPDGDQLTFLVRYSADGGTTYDTLVVDWPEQSLEIETDALAGTSDGIVRVMASDGFNIAMDVSDATFTVRNGGPEAAIFKPHTHVFAGSQIVFLDAFALDSEDGRLSDNSLAWSSDRQGAIGTGENLEVLASTLSDGDHLITLTATDSAGRSATSTEWIFINASSDLEVTKTIEADSVWLGGEIIYTVEVTNRGPNGTSGVVVEDALPAGVSFASADSTRGACLEADHSVRCDLGVMLSGETATVLISVTSTQAGPVSNAVIVRGDARDPAPGNNEHQSTVTVQTLPLIPSISRWGLVVMALALAAAIGWSTLSRSRKRSNA